MERWWPGVGGKSIHLQLRTRIRTFRTNDDVPVLQCPQSDIIE